MIEIKSEEEIEKMREGGKILSGILQEMKKHTAPGVKTSTLNDLAEKLAYKYGGKPSFKGYQGYPASLCVSINEEVVHGIPGSRALQSGDVVGLDFGLFYKGLHTDSAITVGVGELSEEKQQLIDLTYRALMEGIEKIKHGAYLGDFSEAVQRLAEQHGFSVVRELVGHGVGREIHEDPQVPNFGKSGTGLILQEGMTLALEPMLTAGRYHVELADDDWTFFTKDKSLAAHFEHSVVVGKNGVEILT